MKVKDIVKSILVSFMVFLDGNDFLSKWFFFVWYFCN